MRDGAEMWSSLPEKKLETLDLIMTFLTYGNIGHAWRTKFTNPLQRHGSTSSAIAQNAFQKIGFNFLKLIFLARNIDFQVNISEHLTACK